LYNNRPRRVELSPYHTPGVCYIKNDNPEVPVFNYDPVINPMPAYKSEKLSATENLLAQQAVTDEDLE